MPLRVLTGIPKTLRYIPSFGETCWSEPVKRLPAELRATIDLRRAWCPKSPYTVERTPNFAERDCSHTDLRIALAVKTQGGVLLALEVSVVIA